MPTKKRARPPAKTGPKRSLRRGAARQAGRSGADGEGGGDKSTIRRLRRELAAALKRIEELRAIAYIQRYRASGALIVLDVDRLKPINDAFGHAAGDQVLKAIVDVLTRQVRASDVVGRLGGDEFGLLLWNLSETDARAKAAMLEADIDRLAFAFDGKNVTAGASAGVAILGPHSNAARALEEADSVMYVRKAQRRHEPKSAAD
jgi:diguanylate cyclase (GGDEF)-like protein